MSDLDFLKPVFDKIEKSAEAQQQKLHPSFAIELENYALRRGTRRLSDATRRAIVEAVGKAVIERAADQGDVGALSGDLVGAYLRDICPDPFKMCYESALQVTRTVGSPDEARILEDLIGSKD